MGLDVDANLGWTAKLSLFKRPEEAEALFPLAVFCDLNPSDINCHSHAFGGQCRSWRP